MEMVVLAEEINLATLKEKENHQRNIERKEKENGTKGLYNRRTPC